ncbi:acyl-CoA synthetase [Dietzia maris]
MVPPDELRAERELPPRELWRRAESRLSKPLDQGYNVAWEACDRWAADPDRVAMVFSDGRGTRDEWTFARLKDASSRLATALSSLGVTAGARVAGMMERGPAPFVTALAAWRLGAVYVPLYSAFGPSALAYRFEGSTPRVVVADERHLGGVAEALAGCSFDCSVVGVGHRGDTVKTAGELWTLIGGNSPAETIADTRVDDPAVIMYTSGTTGEPKGCVQVHGVVFSLQPFLVHSLALTEDDLVFAGADPGWSYGLFTSGFAVQSLGLPRVVPLGRLDAATWVRIMHDEGATLVAGAPTMLRILVNGAGEEGFPESMRGATCAGEPLDDGLVRRWSEAGGGKIQNTYGQSELGMVLADLAGDDDRWIPGSFGSVVPGFQLELRDPVTGETTDSGLLTVLAPMFQATSGYWGGEAKWKQRWLDDTTFSTGDLMRATSDGRWQFVGRDDDLIITSGYNIGPAEIESILLEHPAVREVAVVAFPDEERGAVVRAVIALTGEPHPGLDEEIKQMVRDRLGRHAVPRIIEIVDELPKTETGKIRRVNIRNEINGKRI